VELPPSTDLSTKSGQAQFLSDPIPFFPSDLCVLCALCGETASFWLVAAGVVHARQARSAPITPITPVAVAAMP
jgi:hypothetical protein